LKTALFQEYKDLKPRWPTSYNRTKLLVQDLESRHWELKLKIKKEAINIDTLTDIRRSNPEKRYVLVYNYPRRHSKDLHTVFAKHYNKWKKVFSCINSHGPINRYPKVKYLLIYMYTLFSFASITISGSS